MEIQRKNSKKRQAILVSLRSVTDHPTAEMIYNRLKPEYPDLSLGTVYRNLNVLMQDGLIITVGHVNGEERYDANTSDHSHFVCTKCGRVNDIFLDLSIDKRYPNVAELMGGKVKGHSLSYFGLCKNCCE